MAMRGDIDEVVAACDLLVDNGVTQISLADTVGLATPKLVADVVADVMAVHDGVGDWGASACSV